MTRTRYNCLLIICIKKNVKYCFQVGFIRYYIRVEINIKIQGNHLKVTKPYRQNL